MNKDVGQVMEPGEAVCYLVPGMKQAPSKYQLLTITIDHYYHVSIALVTVLT